MPGFTKPKPGQVPGFAFYGMPLHSGRIREGESAMRASMLSIAATLLATAGLALPTVASAAPDCSAPPVTPGQSATVAPISSELVTPSGQLGVPGGVLSQAYDGALTVEQVLLRMYVESCRSVAGAAPAPGVVDPNDPATYKPRTEFDNTPWRFNMSQNGRNMTADEFSAWMASRGVRVARGPATAQAPAPAPAPAATAAAPEATGELPTPPPAAPELAQPTPQLAD